MAAPARFSVQRKYRAMSGARVARCASSRACGVVSAIVARWPSTAHSLRICVSNVPSSHIASWAGTKWLCASTSTSRWLAQLTATAASASPRALRIMACTRSHWWLPRKVGETSDKSGRHAPASTSCGKRARRGATRGRPAAASTAAIAQNRRESAGPRPGRPHYATAAAAAITAGGIVWAWRAICRAGM